MRNHQLNPTLPILKIPRSRLEITVHSFCRPWAVYIAFEVLACGNCHAHMGHGHLTPLLSSQSVSRGHQVFNLKQQRVISLLRQHVEDRRTSRPLRSFRTQPSKASWL